MEMYKGISTLKPNQEELWSLPSNTTSKTEKLHGGRQKSSYPKTSSCHASHQQRTVVGGGSSHLGYQAEVRNEMVG